MKRFIFPLLAFIIPALVYCWVILGWSIGEDCVAGVNGPNSAPISNFYYCQQQVDTGAYVWQHLPQWKLVSKDWKNGIIPLWNPHQGTGVPLAANFISGAFNPLLLLFSSFDSLLVIHYYFVFRLSLASLGTYLFLRKIGNHRLPSLAGGIFFVLSGYFTQFFSIHHHDVDFYLPWLLYVALFAIENKRYWGVNSILIALSIFVGMPESNIFILGFYLAYCLHLIFTHPPQNKFGSILNLVLSTIYGLAISAVLLFPGLEYVANSANTRVIGLKDIFSVHTKNIFYWILPRISGPFYNLLSRDSELKIVNINYFGTIASLLTLVGLLSKGQRFIKVVLIAALLQYFGLINFPFSWFPILRDTVYIKYSLGVINFLSAILIAKAINDWSDNLSRRRIALKIFIAILIYGAIYFVHDLYKVLPYAPLWKTKATLVFITFQIIASSTLTFFLFRIKQTKYLVLILILEMALYTPFWGSRLKNPSIQTPEFVTWLIDHNDGSRIFSTDGYLYPDYASFYGLNDIRNLDALWPSNTYQYLNKYIQPKLDLAMMRFASLVDATGQEPAKILNNPFFDQLAIKYLVSGSYIESTQLILRYDKEVKIYENIAALPRLRFADKTQGLSNTNFNENTVTANYTTVKESEVVLADTYYPGWTARVNGIPTPVTQTEGLFRSIKVPKGEGVIEFLYQPVSFYVGLKVSILGILGTALLLLF